MMQTQALNVRELKPGFGAQILDVDLTAADENTLAAVVDTFHRRGAILLRNQNMAPDDLLSFLRHFGQLEGHTLQQYTLPGYPNIFVLSNKMVNGRPIGAHNDGVGWHTDYSYKAEPVMCTMLYGVEVPAEGSDTLLADMCSAYNALSPQRQRELDKLTLHHSYKYFMETRKFAKVQWTPELEAENPDVFHPLIRVHPADGRKALWPSTGTVKGIVGMADEEALQLIEELVEFGTQEQFVFRHKWQAGDILMWDNRCTLHTGTLYDDKKYFREIHRLWVKGDKPIAPAV